MTTIKRLKVSFVDKDTMKAVSPYMVSLQIENEEIVAYKVMPENEDDGSYEFYAKEVEIRVEDGGSVINI